ncbi:Eco57I restriction-modification methylase domain-containing protein, partial [Thiospirillum jenense]
LEPLPNIDFNLLTGNSLVGLLQVNAAAYSEQQKKHADLFSSGEYARVVAEKNRLIGLYRDTTAEYSKVDLAAIKQEINQHRTAAQLVLNDLLLQEMGQAGVKFEQATWDDAKQKLGKPIKRALTTADVAQLKPFHWGFEFDQVLNERGGFDAIITNPPWE